MQQKIESLFITTKIKGIKSFI